MKLPNVVVCVNASTQLNPREMASTTNSGFTISATEEGARYSGRNEQMAMNVAPSNPHWPFSSKEMAKVVMRQLNKAR